jgi:hypothetical protein
VVAFDLPDLDAAYEELDARYVAREAAPWAGTTLAIGRRFAEAIATRDWARLATMLAPDFELEDHRPIGVLTSLSRDEWVASVRELVGLRPETVLRTDHVLAVDRQGVLVVARWTGADGEGAFEIPMVVVMEIGPYGFRRWDAYPMDDLDAARARFDALGARAPARLPAD